VTIILRPPWTRQPQVAVELDRNNALARSITHFLPLNGDRRELIGGSQITYGASGATAPDSRGLVLATTSTTGARGSVPLNLSASNVLSVSFWLWWDAFANDNLLAFEFTSNGSKTPGILNLRSFIVNPNSSTSGGRFQVGARGTFVAAFRSFPRFTAQQWTHVALVLVLDLVSNGLSAAWVNGVRQTLTTDVSNSLTGTFSNDTLHLFSRESDALFGNGRLQNLAFRLGHFMTDDEARSEYENPWQLFAPRQIWVPYTAAPAIPTLSAPTFVPGSLSTTGWRGRVTAT